MFLTRTVLALVIPAHCKTITMFATHAHSQVCPRCWGRHCKQSKSEQKLGHVWQTLCFFGSACDSHGEAAVQILAPSADRIGTCMRVLQTADQKARKQPPSSQPQLPVLNSTMALQRRFFTTCTNATVRCSVSSDGDKCSYECCR